MFFIYQILILLIIFLSPVIIIIRLIKNKEHKERFIEKFCFFKKKRNKGNLIWLHAASVGELMSIIPLIYEIEKNKKVNNILITTSTLSSSKIFNNYKFKKVVHQFFPIDFFYFTSKFIKYWKPSVAVFIDSEIWPCMFKELKKNSIPLLLMNARITSKSFARWNFFNKFSKNIFHYIKAAFPQNQETEKFLKKLKVAKIYKIGNLKFCETKKQKKISLPKTFLSSIKNRPIFCASSTHPTEEHEIAKAHLTLRKKYKNLLTIIIPRHIERVNEIYTDLTSLNLKVIIRSSNKKIYSNTDIYLVDSYGETKRFFNISKITFIGGSVINHGGQNPIEPARFGLKILHGPYIKNFKDIYQLFNKSKIAYKFNNLKELIAKTDKLLMSKKNNKLDLVKIGNLILKKNVNEIYKVFNNEIKKT
jgi:3-deoxy-D-manno-octulosonic-acid transferase